MKLNFFPWRKLTGTLVLLRHAESEWNAKGVWSGITDVELSEKGMADRAIVADKFDALGMPIHVAIYTDQKRTKQTLDGVAEARMLRRAEHVLEPGFNERNYGEYTGMDKWKVKEEIGPERFQAIRRGWDVPFPNGETLKEVYERVVPAYETTVLPRLQAGENVLIVAHGNSLRALMKYLDSIPDDKIAELEMLMNQLVVYHIDPTTGLQQSKEVIDTGVNIESHF
jgi:2,3-bisphosphoglycerate-dependent phosphoglycerate mutase